MSREKYTVIISNENKEVKAQLIGKDFTTRFDPLTVLCDLKTIVMTNEDVKRWAVNKETGEVYETMISYNRFRDTYKNHPLFQSLSLQRRIEKYRQFDNQSAYRKEKNEDGEESYDIKVEFNTLFILADEIMECFSAGGTNVSLKDFDIFKTIADLKYTYTIDYLTENPWFTEREAILEAIDEASEVFPDIANKVDMETEHIFSSASCISITAVRDIHKEYYKKNKPMRYTYECESIREVIHCIWHYLISHKYDKFKGCEHCGKLFAINHMSTTFCTRLSPFYFRDGRKPCGHAVRLIKRRSAKRYDYIKGYLEDFYEPKALKLFEEKYLEKYKIVDANSSIENLLAYEQFLSKENVRQNWYLPEYKVDTVSDHYDYQKEVLPDNYNLRK